MDKDFLDQYKETIINKQKSINYHQLAFTTLLQAAQKRNIEKESILSLEKNTERIMNTFIELYALQMKKMNLTNSYFFYKVSLIDGNPLMLDK